MPATEESASSKFTRIFDALPPEGKRYLESQLFALLDTLPRDDAANILTESSNIKRRYQKLPSLNLRGKKREIVDLLEEIVRDSKLSIVKERSVHRELVAETVESILDWIGVVWIVVYEFQVNFELAHECLLFMEQALKDLKATRKGGCNCCFMNMPVTFYVRNTEGHCVHSFEFTGGIQIEDILLWTWRELLVSMISCEKSTDTMLDDIETTMGWDALERIVFGGNFKLDLDVQEIFKPESHWSPAIVAARSSLQDMIASRLTQTFALIPSLDLWSAAHIVCKSNRLETRKSLLSTLSLIATSTSETFGAALDIYSSEELHSEIAALLLSGKTYVLNASESTSLQNAVITLGSMKPTGVASKVFKELALRILEESLIKTALEIRARTSSAFSSSIHDLDMLQDLEENVLSQRATEARSGDIENWIDQVMPADEEDFDNPMNNPMMMAAAMMGLPVPIINPEEIGADDGLAFLDIDGSSSGVNTDPDLEDVIEEFRPRLKARWEGWIDVAENITGGTNVLAKVYENLIGIEMMPYLRGADIVECLIARISDKPSKHFLCDALDCLATFCKRQYKKSEKKRKAELAGKTRSVNQSRSTIGGRVAATTTARKAARNTPTGTLAPPAPTNASENTHESSEMPTLFSIEDDPSGLEDVD